MSSDVYIRFYDPQDLNFENCVDQLRLGDIGVLSYFGYNALCDLHTISDNKSPNDSWRLSMLDILVKIHSSVAKDKVLNQKDFCMRYGYIGPVNIEWEDHFEEDLINCIMSGAYNETIMRIEWD